MSWEETGLTIAVPLVLNFLGLAALWGGMRQSQKDLESRATQLEEKTEQVAVDLNAHRIETAKFYVSNEQLERHIARFEQVQERNYRATEQRLTEIRGDIQRVNERFEQYFQGPIRPQRSS